MTDTMSLPLFALDEDPESGAALEKGVTELLSTQRDAKLGLLHVLKIPSSIPTQLGMMPYQIADKQYQEGYKRTEMERVEKFMRAYQAYCRRFGFVASIIIHWSVSCESGILEIIRENGSTLLILGTGGPRKGLFGRLKGPSLTARVSQQAPCHVYLIDKNRQVVSHYIYRGPSLQPNPAATAEQDRLRAEQLAEMQRRVEAAEKEQARRSALLAEMQAKQDEMARLLEEAHAHAASTRQEHERERQESALAVQEAREAAERERQNLVAERQQAAERNRELLELQRLQTNHRIYSLAELMHATNDLDPALKLGEGGFGKVYLGRLQHTPAAIKVLDPEGLQGPEQFKREVEILSRLRHPHIVMLMGCCPEPGCLVYEYCANGSLEDRLACKDNSAPLPWYTRVRTANEMAIALLYMHNSHPRMIIHKDVKPANVLLDQNLTCKIGDVGIAEMAPRRAGSLLGMTSLYHSRLQGTPLYMDPEYARTGTFNQKSDVYAYGVCLLQLLVNRSPLGIIGAVETALNNGTLMDIVDRTAGDWPPGVACTIAKLGIHCSQTSRRARPNLADVLPELHATTRLAMEASALEASQGVNRGVNPRATLEDAVPSIFLCPISLDLMTNPVVAADGNT